jgi:RES domain-containing protein
VALVVELTIATGQWFRQTPGGVDPARRPIPPDDNRWQRGRVVDAVYFAADHDCAWAEWYRHLAERGIPPQAALPRDLWTYDVESLELVDLRGAEPLARVGLPMPSPGRRTWPAFQAIGEQLHRDGFAGILAPSAARPESVVMCVFLSTGSLAGAITPRLPPRRVNEPPVPPTGMRT